jgi:large subunit ribosomal protein L21
MITDNRSGPDSQVIKRAIARGGRTKAFTQIIPADQVAGRGVTDGGVDVALARTADCAWRLQEEQVVIIQSEHGSFWQLLAHRAGSLLAGILDESTGRFDPMRSVRVAWTLGAHASAGALRVPSYPCVAHHPIQAVRESRLGVYAIVRSGGRQHKVVVGDVLEVDRLEDAVGSSISLTPLLLVDGDAVTSDASALGSASVTAEVLAETKGPKIRILKFKNKTGYRKRQGHRQRYTKVLVTDIKS